MIDVLLESNWVFDYCAPEHRREEGAARLLDLADRGSVRLHIPALCLREGANIVRQKCQPRLGDVREFRRWAAAKQTLDSRDSEVVVRFFDAYTAEVKHQLDAIDERLDVLRALSGIEVFALDDAMLERAMDLRRTPDAQHLRPFDESVLAAVLVRAESIRAAGRSDIRFCTLDTDLWPHSRRGEVRPGLQRLYDDAGIRVQTGFDIPEI